MGDKATLVQDLTRIKKDLSDSKTAEQAAQEEADAIEAFCLSLKVKPGITIAGTITGTSVEGQTTTLGDLE